MNRFIFYKIILLNTEFIEYFLPDLFLEMEKGHSKFFVLFLKNFKTIFHLFLLFFHEKFNIALNL